MEKCRVYQREKMLLYFSICLVLFLFLIGRVVYIIVAKGDSYTQDAIEMQQRERVLSPQRGEILDRNGVVLATSESVYNILVIHNQITDPDTVIDTLSRELDLPKDYVQKRVEKVTSIEKIKFNVKRDVGEKIRALNLAGVKVDEGYKRIYPYGTLASKVLGFTGGDGQGILGLEAKYDSYLAGKSGVILTYTDVRGREIASQKEERKEPVAGYDLVTSIDWNVQSYCDQIAEKMYIQKQADGVEIIAMNPQNGEIYAMVDYPEYNLNQPFELVAPYDVYEQMGQLDEGRNRMWRNYCVSDTYEPGSIFKTVTTTIALENNLVSLDEGFYCPGYNIVEDRRIRCHKTTGHGAETFTQALYNSCNPVFIDIGLRIGTDRFCKGMEQLDLLNKTHIDLPGEAGTIMHKKENIGPVELATMSFGQSFQVSPIRMMTTVSEIINGGNYIEPHVGVSAVDENNQTVCELYQKQEKSLCSKATSETMRELLEGVVSEGGGSKAYIEGYEIGGKTATSQTLPRSDNVYISSFVGFAPADNPKIILLVIIRNPKGVYYGGTIAAPVARQIFENILPYLDN